MTVKIFGPKRSGTNLLKWILQHYPVKILVDVDRFGEPCWKHGYPRKSADKHIIITKSPVDWHVSYRAFPDLEREQSLEDYRSLCESYEVFQQANKDTIWINWSELVGDWQQGIERITSFVGVEPRSVIEQPNGRLNITADAGKAAQTRGEFAPPEDAGSLICPHEAAILGDETEGNSRVVHIKQPYNGYGDAMMSLWVCEGLRQAGKVADSLSAATPARVCQAMVAALPGVSGEEGAAVGA